MSASSKFDFSSCSPDRSLYGHRGSYDTTSLDRSGRVREDMESPLLSSMTNMTRSGSSLTKGDVLNFFQCLRLNPKAMVVEHKLNRPAEFKRYASAAVGIPLEDSPPTSSKSKQLSSRSLEDLRRLKSGARECGTKARERVKIFNDCLSAINKCFPSIPSRKRSRLDSLDNDRSNTSLLIDRPASRMGISKLATQNYDSTSGLELQHHKSEEMTKNVSSSKRTRTSMKDDKMDVQPTTAARPSGIFNKDSGVIKLSNSTSVNGEGQTSAIAVGCWENPKTKKKRTVKADATSSMKTKPLDGYWESKQGTQSQVSTEASPRLTGVRGFRSGIANGVVGVGKAEPISQTSSGIRLSISRAASNHNYLHEKRERPTGQEEEVVDLKALNKANSRDVFISGSPTSSSKLNANVRAPRSSSIGSVSKLSQTAQRSPSTNDWEVSNCTSKVPSVPMANNRKHRPSIQSTSPSVASWVQRPQKISRTARRNNFLPIAPGNDESPVTDMTSDMAVNLSHFSANSPEQVKIKGDNFSSAALSESEESGATGDKFRKKNKKGNEINEKSGQNVQKMSTLLPTRKKKRVNKDNSGDGIRRQGRTGRGFPSSRSLVPLTVEKVGSMETTKQISTSRLGSDKPESRAARPPTRKKLSDRKASTRQKHTASNVAADSLDGSDNGHEEFLAATNAVMNTAQALSSPFWKKMEPLFRFICDEDLTYLKEQVNLHSAMDLSVPVLDANSSTFLPNGSEFETEEIDVGNAELSPELAMMGAKTPDGISLYQRLIAALIPEEQNEELLEVENEVINYDPYGSWLHVEKEKESNGSDMSEGCDPSGYYVMNVYDLNTNRRSFYELDHLQDDSAMTISDAGYDHMQNGFIADQLSGPACSEYRYNNMPINERLLLEIHSIGIYPDLVSGDGGIRDNISGLHEKYREQVSKNKILHGKLLSYVSKAKELQERESEGRMLDKLVGMAYEKYMGCWGPNAHGMKSATGKLAKQAALAFIKRTLKHCQEFETTGKSCFEEPVYRDMFLSGVSSLVNGPPLTCSTEDESDKLHPGKSGCSVEVRTLAPQGTHQSPSSNNQEAYSSEMLSASLASEPNTPKEEMWADRVKRRELLLDDVGVRTSISSGVPSGVGGSLYCNAKGKRSDRDRAGKGREVLCRSENTKLGRPASSTGKGERKPKAKSKQKTSHLSASVNGPLGKTADRLKVSKSSEIMGTAIGKDTNEYNLDMLEEEPIDLSGLQIPDMDDMSVPNGLNGPEGDIGSWLNFEDDGLHDHDFSGGLGIPLDDLADVNMVV